MPTGNLQKWSNHLRSGMGTALLVLLAAGPVRGQIFVASGNLNGVIGEYTTTGTPINSSLVTGLHIPSGIAMDGNGNLFVANYYVGTRTIGEYDSSGQALNSSLISGLAAPFGLALDGNGNLFVGNRAANGSIGKYSTSGATTRT